MKISILGTGMVGMALAPKMISLGHEVFMGTRDVDSKLSDRDPNPMTGLVFDEWHKDHEKVQLVHYGALPIDSDLFINATSGKGSIEALTAVGQEKLKDKIILDVANPLDFSQGMPPTLTVCNTDSLGEQIQREFPDSMVVKGLNTLNAKLMANPSMLEGDHNLIICGNHTEAKKMVMALLVSIGWNELNIIDLGDITSSRATEMLLPLWTRLFGKFGNPDFNFAINRKAKKPEKPEMFY